ncbi:MAG: SemiSWEET transporter [Flavisolibacter sp.]|nr:SemiSWEET transporter [Flavisolibacter sp.]MBD0289336.1 SemiSWEET transporter [Flavisolibacter sp.]MBD0296436.1 SemiSWEET transporter [Flavisolibacter sp.]MBD0352309.1 SemiSWEET transporter [Flavisolibacter sp.]MBD0368113.1 SemiSWEET transporter [Flavisolibacter sp.]
MNWTQVIGIAAGVLTGVSMLPQLIKIIKEKEAENVSIAMLVVLLSGLALWISYGLLREDWPIIVTNCFSFLVNMLTLVFRIRYSGTK